MYPHFVQTNYKTGLTEEDIEKVKEILAEKMKTPIEWSENLKEGIITEEMLDAALYSVNKRAKNCRDKKNDYNKIYSHYSYQNSEKYADQEQEYYKIKHNILQFLNPICIHKELLNYEKTRVYDYDKNFDNKLVRAFTSGRIVWSNSYVERDYDDYDRYDYDFGKRVYFFDEINLNRPIYKYYLFYKIGEHSYHEPIEETRIKNYPDIPVVTIGRIVTEGRDIDELYSVQFARKVEKIIAEKDTKILAACFNEYWLDEMQEIEMDKNDTEQQVDEVLSNNISSSMAFWEEYIISLVKEKFKSVLSYEEILKQKRDALLEFSVEYKNDLTRNIRNRKKDIKNWISTLDKNLKNTSKKSKVESRCDKIRKNIMRLCEPDKSRCGDIGFEDREFFESIFICFDMPYEYVPFPVDTVSELIDVYRDCFPENELTPEERAVVKEHLYKEYSSDIITGFYCEELNHIENLKKRLCTNIGEDK